MFMEIKWFKHFKIPIASLYQHNTGMLNYIEYTYVRNLGRPSGEELSRAVTVSKPTLKFTN